MNNCIFCQIVRGEKPAKIVYENENVICFLPNKIEIYGHTLVVPKQHFQDLYDIPQDLLCRLIEVVQLLTNEYKTKISATGMNVLHASGKDSQQSVPHFHFHLFPRFKDDGLDTWPNLTKKEFDAEEIWQKLKMTS
ncbi:MAG TPA: HIT family protein [Candidatus Paceibacterota bacterium]|nr:HIT family protein [Candidatus Paceibacterota bacterium]HRU35790.1 HIT family protein [Candidatus Paceibacterota bacterium]